MVTGETGIAKALASIGTQKTGENAKGRTAMFGQIYYWLANANSDPDFDPVRDIIANHITDTMPVGPEDQLFGKDVRVRKIHSVWSASRQYRMDRDRLRLMLIEGGWVDANSDLPFNWMTFDAHKSEEFLKDAKSSLNYLQALKYLNAPKSHEPILVASGLLKPWMAAGASGLKDHAFRARDLDAFLGRLMERADERYSSDPAFMNISAAQKRVVCGAEAILRLIFDGKLERVGKRIGVDGYNSVLVDPREVERLVLKKDKDTLSTKEAAVSLGASQSAVLALIAASLLPATDGRHPKTNRKMKFVSRLDLKRFSAVYVSLAEAARSARVNLHAFRCTQTRAGITPAFDSGIVLYRRADLKVDDL